MIHCAISMVRRARSGGSGFTSGRGQAGQAGQGSGGGQAGGQAGTLFAHFSRNRKFFEQTKKSIGFQAWALGQTTGIDQGQAGWRLAAVSPRASPSQSQVNSDDPHETAWGLQNAHRQGGGYSLSARTVGCPVSRCSPAISGKMATPTPFQRSAWIGRPGKNSMPCKRPMQKIFTHPRTTDQPRVSACGCEAVEIRPHCRRHTSHRNSRQPHVQSAPEREP